MRHAGQSVRHDTTSTFRRMSFVLQYLLLALPYIYSWQSLFFMNRMPYIIPLHITTSRLSLSSLANRAL